MIDLDESDKDWNSCILTKTILRVWESIIKQSLKIVSLSYYIVVVFVVLNYFLQDAASIEIVFLSLVGTKFLDKTLHCLDLLRSNLFRDRLIEFVILDVEKLV